MTESSAPIGRLIDSQRLREWSKVRPWRNLGWLALDYACVLIAGTFAVWFHLQRPGWGLHWSWEVPVIGAAVLMIGILQHRIALMGHEGSHYLLVPNRWWNDLLVELLIYYPLFSSVILYRKRHLGHHLHPNDPAHDPNLYGGKVERIWSKFPMSRQLFAIRYYLSFFWPPFVLRNLLDLFVVLTVGGSTSKSGSKSSRLNPALLGLLYFLLLMAAMIGPLWLGMRSWPLMTALFVVAVAVWAWLPADSFAKGGNFACHLKGAALMKLCFYTAFFLTLGHLTGQYGGGVVVAFLLFWVLPLIYVFPYLMVLREIYQHANAGTGDLDNSRIIHANAFLRWALFCYGNDLHLIHHLYPGIPHDRLAEVHETLAKESAAYRAGVQETFGIAQSSPAGHSLMDALTTS